MTSEEISAQLRKLGKSGWDANYRINNLMVEAADLIDNLVSTNWTLECQAINAQRETERIRGYVLNGTKLILDALKPRKGIDEADDEE